MDYDGDDEKNAPLREYNRSLKVRVENSMHQLQRSLEHSPKSPNPARRGSRRNQSPSPRAVSPHPTGTPRSPSPHHGGTPRARSPHNRSPLPGGRIGSPGRDYSYGSAVGKLRNLLRKHEPSPTRNVQFQERPYSSPAEAQSYAPASLTPGSFSQYRSIPLPRGEIPSPEECVPLLQNQAVLIQQLEAQNKYCQDELQVLKLKLRETIEENQLLHDELKRSSIQDLLQEGGDMTGMPSSLPLPSRPADVRSDPGRPMTREDYGHWQRELERIHTLHTATESRLEAQLQHAREESQKYEGETEDLRKELRMRDSLNKADPELLGLAAGLCIRCATNEAVVQPSGLAQGQQVTALTQERDELVSQLAVMRTKYEEVRQREDDMYQQVKRSVEIVEQTQLEGTEVLLQRDQYREELVSMQQRVAEHAEDMMTKMAAEREIVRKEFRAERDELAHKVKDLTGALTETQLALDKTSRDKVNLISELEVARSQVDTCDLDYGKCSVVSELEVARSQVDTCDLDYGKATDTMKMSMTQATVERNSAVGEMAKMRKEVEALHKDRDQERSRIHTELYDVRRRLAQAEKELVEAKEECINLHNTQQSLQRETHLARLAKETIEKTRRDDLRNIEQRAEHRESELNMLLDQLEAKHASSTSELENLVSSQSRLIQKLRGECKTLARQLEDTTHKYRGENKKLQAQSSQLRVRLDRAQRRLRELEDQHTQHGALQEKMRERIRQMDGHATKTTQQVLDLIGQESAVVRDRQLLAKEVEFLRTQMLDRSDAEISRYYSTQKGLVDDILVDMKGQDEARLRMDKMAPERDYGGPHGGANDQHRVAEERHMVADIEKHMVADIERELELAGLGPEDEAVKVDDL